MVRASRKGAIRRASISGVACSWAVRSAARPSSSVGTAITASSSSDESLNASTKPTQKAAWWQIVSGSHTPWKRRISIVPCFAIDSRLSEQ